MLRKSWLLFVIILIAAVVAYLLINKNIKPGNGEAGSQSFSVENTENIGAIFMADRANHKVRLEKQEDGSWQVNEKYPVRKAQIDLLLRTLKTIEVRYPIPGKAYPSVVEMMSVENTVVEIYDLQGELMKSYFVGPPARNNRGNYMKMKDSDEIFIVHIPGFDGHLSSRYVTAMKAWRSREIFAYKERDISAIQVEYPGHRKESFRINRIEKDSFEVKALYDEQMNEFPVDQKMANTYVSYFKKLHAETFANNASIKDSIIDHSTPYSIVTVKDADNKMNRITVYRKPLNKRSKMQTDPEGNPIPYDLDRYYALINNGKDFVIIQQFVFGKIFIGASNFFKKELLGQQQ